MAKIVVGLGYGDEGKGTIVDFLARGSPAPVTVVRFNGGGQAAHNVIDADGTHHTFSQFGSGTLSGARTHLSRFMLVDPFSMHAEAVHLAEIMGPETFDDTLRDVFRLVTIDKECTIVTPFHIAANRIREAARGNERHGSCGMGIHEAASDREKGIFLRAGQLSLEVDLIKDGVYEPHPYHCMREIQARKLASFDPATLEEVARQSEDLAVQVQILRDPEAPGLFLETMRTLLVNVHFTEGLEVGIEDELIFEGAQGVLLDEEYGLEFPYVTHSTTTPANALTLLEEIEYEGEIQVIGVTRPYHTRHGRGPFPQENAWLTRRLPDEHNGYGDWQEGFRVGQLAHDQLQYAVGCCGGIDAVAVTCLDRLPDMLGPGFAPENVTLADIESTCGAPVIITSHGPSCTDKVWLNETSAVSP